MVKAPKPGLGEFPTEDLESILRELIDSPPRSSVLTAASLIDYALERLIGSHLRTPSKKNDWELFTDNGLFGTFSRKIMGAYYMKLIGPNTRRELDIIRAIRNDCAHDLKPVTFATLGIASRCRELRAFLGRSFSDEPLAMKLLLSATAVQFFAQVELLLAPEEVRKKWAATLEKAAESFVLPAITE